MYINISCHIVCYILASLLDGYRQKIEANTSRGQFLRQLPKKYKQKQMTPLQPTVLYLSIIPALSSQPTLYFSPSASLFSIDFPPSMQTSIKAAAMTCIKGKQCGRNTPSMCENLTQLTKHARERKREIATTSFG